MTFQCLIVAELQAGTPVHTTGCPGSACRPRRLPQALLTAVLGGTVPSRTPSGSPCLPLVTGSCVLSPLAEKKDGFRFLFLLASRIGAIQCHYFDLRLPNNYSSYLL